MALSRPPIPGRNFGSTSKSLGAAGAIVGMTPRGTPGGASLAMAGGASWAPREGGASACISSPSRSGRSGGAFRDRPQDLGSSAKKGELSSQSLVRALKGIPMTSAGEFADKKDASPMAHSDGDCDSDCGKSVCSNSSQMSNMSSMSTISGGGKRGSIASSARSSRSTSTVHMSFNDCSIDIEQDSRQGGSRKMSLCTEFTQLVGEYEGAGNKDCGQAEGLVQCLQMYGYSKPNKLQQHAIPALLHHMGRHLSGKPIAHSGKGKSCIVIQGPSQAGKTSSVVMSLLAAIDVDCPQPQAILLSSGSKRDFDKYLNVFSLMQPVNFQAFMDDDEEHEPELTEASQRVHDARNTHILVGHPKRILKLLSVSSQMRLDALKVLIIDDAELLLSYSGDNATSSTQHVLPPRKPTTPPDGTQRQAGSRPTPFCKPQQFSNRGTPEEPLSPLSPKSPLSPTNLTLGSSSGRDGQTLGKGPQLHHPQLDDIVQICNVLECRMYSQNQMDTYRIRSGEQEAEKLRYVILMDKVADASSRKVLRLLKNSLMQKKNLLNPECIAPPTKVIKAMKHYYAQPPRSDWVKVFSGLVQSLMFPRALIFCDDDNIGKYYKEMLEMGIDVSANLPEMKGANGEPMGAAEARRRAIQDFTGNKTQFLLTRSEPAICQVALPKVSCVFHFGLPKDTASIYGVRLLPLDATTAKDAASILFLDAPDVASSAMPPVVAGVGKLFDVRFMDMPFEFLPGLCTTAGNTGAGKRHRPLR